MTETTFVIIIIARTLGAAFLAASCFVMAWSGWEYQIEEYREQGDRLKKSDFVVMVMFTGIEAATLYVAWLLFPFTLTFGIAP